MSVQMIGPEPEPEKESLGLDDLTAAESAMAERKAAQSIATLGNEAFPQVGLLGALGWVLARRVDPRLTYESYMATHKVSEITRELGLTGTDSDDEEEAGKDDD
jgi:hypothetical protein